MQVLFAFLLAVPFQARFGETTTFQRDVYFARARARADRDRLPDRADRGPSPELPPERQGGDRADLQSARDRRDRPARAGDDLRDGADQRHAVRQDGDGPSSRLLSALRVRPAVGRAAAQPAARASDERLGPATAPAVHAHRPPGRAGSARRCATSCAPRPAARRCWSRRALAALVWANVDAGSYASVWGTQLSIRLGDWTLAATLRHWVNDGLMALFFLVVGLEARRELDLGELRERRRLLLPALAGARRDGARRSAIFLAFNAGGAGGGGWGVAMSTDTAFAIGIARARRAAAVRRACACCLLTLLVVDDLVALVVIAIAYTSTCRLRPLAVAVGLFAVLLALRASCRRARGRVDGLVGVALWVAVLESGIDPVDRRPRDGPADVRLPGRARRPRAGDRPLPRLPRAADRASSRGRARAASTRRSRRTSGCSTRFHPWTSYVDRAAVRARERRHRARRRLRSATRSARR